MKQVSIDYFFENMRHADLLPVKAGGCPFPDSRLLWSGLAGHLIGFGCYCVNYPEGVDFPESKTKAESKTKGNNNKKSKGIACLPNNQLLRMLEAFEHPVHPITFCVHPNPLCKCRIHHPT
jgi:hypothetical protein